MVTEEWVAFGRAGVGGETKGPWRDGRTRVTGGEWKAKGWEGVLLW